MLLLQNDDMQNIASNQAQVEFLLGGVHKSQSDQTITSLLSAETNFSVCYPTTWSHGNGRAGSTSLDKRKLHALSKALSHFKQ